MVILEGGDADKLEETVGTCRNISCLTQAVRLASGPAQLHSISHGPTLPGSPDRDIEKIINVHPSQALP